MNDGKPTEGTYEHPERNKTMEMANTTESTITHVLIEAQKMLKQLQFSISTRSTYYNRNNAKL